jgi:hypothetical protein
MIVNVHSRQYFGSDGRLGELIDALGSGSDRLWPSDRWPALRLDRSLAVGASGGHGPIRYWVESYTPGVNVVFRFDPRIGLVGTHRLEVTSDDRLTHTIEAAAHGWMRLLWPTLVRPMHDALLEDALDNVDAVLDASQPVRRHMSARVRMARRVAGHVAAGKRDRSVAPRSEGRRLESVAASVALAVAAAIHLLWAAGSTWPAPSSLELAQLVVGTNTFPSAGACVAVAGLLGVAALCIQQRTSPRAVLSTRLSDNAAVSIASVMVLRAVGGFVTSGLMGRAKGLPYRQADLLLYSPFCLAVAVAVWRATGRDWPGAATR